MGVAGFQQNLIYDPEISVIYDLHVSWSAILFFLTCKNSKAIFNSQILQNQMTGWIHPGLDSGSAWTSGVFENPEN